MSVTLWSYRFSVYGRIVRLALHDLGQQADLVEVDPFADPPPPLLAGLHSFGRVPVLRHDDFTLYETAAILRYLDATFAGGLVPKEPRAQARMTQAIGIADAYAYSPLVRQVFGQAVFAPREGRRADPDVIAAGLADARPVLAALDAIAAEGLVLTGRTQTLADLHLAPMLAYFIQVPAAAALLAGQPALSRWWQAMQDRPGLAATDPGLP